MPFTIVGVTPRAFLGPEVGTAFDVAVPIGTEPLVRASSFVSKPRAQWLTIMARLDPGDTRDAAHAACTRFSRSCASA